MDSLLETIHYKGYDIEVHSDYDSESPRDWDNLGTMVCFHSRYDLGDKNEYFDSPDDLREYIEKNDVIYLPLYLYDHSGITMNTGGFSCPWDSGQVGIIYIECDKVRKEYGWKRITKKRIKKICEYLDSEVKTYDDYLTGNVHGFIIEKDNEPIDSCWGFIGDPDYMISEAKGIIDWHIKNERKKHFNKLKSYIKGHVPLIHREGCPV